MLLITAAIWGSAFVAQSLGVGVVGPFTFSAVRALMALAVLIPVIYFFSAQSRRRKHAPFLLRILPDRWTVFGGIWCGIALTIAEGLQQIGLLWTGAGKAGFITSLYIIIVPLMGILLGRKIRSLVWLCVIIAAAGFYFLCIKEDFTAETGDIFILASTLFYSVHIYVIDHFLMHNADAIKMSWVQFGAQAAGASVIALIFETPQFSSVMEAFPSIAYAGVLSSGVAFTLQNLGQKYMDDASVATLLMSLESVFAVLTGWAVLGEVLTPREIFGCVLVFAAVLLAQKPQKIEIGQ